MDASPKGPQKSEARNLSPAGEPGSFESQEGFIEGVVSDACAIPEVRMLFGFAGDSCRGEGYRRLYCTPEFNVYVEFAFADELHRQPFTLDRFPLSGTLVWLKAEATLQYTRVESREAQCEYLQGDLVGGWRIGCAPEGFVTRPTTFGTAIPWCPVEHLRAVFASGLPCLQDKPTAVRTQVCTGCG